MAIRKAGWWEGRSKGLGGNAAWSRGILWEGGTWGKGQESLITGEQDPGAHPKNNTEWQCVCVCVCVHARPGRGLAAILSENNENINIHDRSETSGYLDLDTTKPLRK